MPARHRPDLRTTLTVVSVVALAGFMLLTIGVEHGNFLLGRGSRIDHFVRELGDRYRAESIMAHTRNTPAYLTLLAVVGLITARTRTVRLGLAVSVGPLVAWWAAEHVFKPILDRRSITFPSGHTAAVTACALAFWLAAGPGRRWARTVLATAGIGATGLISWAAVASRAHAPIDVLGGGLLGLGVVATAFLLALSPATASRGGSSLGPSRSPDDPERATRVPA